jgi:hypothetical protein
MGNCDEARALIAFGVGLLFLSGLGAAVSWAYAVRVVRASRQVIALRDAYRSTPVEFREMLAQSPDSTPRA